MQINIPENLNYHLYTQKPNRIKKAWGWEDVIVNNDKYCAKILHFNKGAKFSLHMHREKHETWFLSYGELELLYINTQDGSQHTIPFKEGEVIIVPPMFPHQLIAKQESEVFESSTPHADSDSYRVAPGDSQSPKKPFLKPFRKHNENEPINFMNFGYSGCIGTAWCPECKCVVIGTCLCGLVCDKHGPVLTLKYPDGLHDVRLSGTPNVDERCKRFYLSNIEVAFYLEGQGWKESSYHKSLIDKGLRAEKKI